MTSYDWIIGIGLMFSLALIFSKITYNNLLSFFIFLTFFSGFVVASELLPLWVLILNVVILTIFIYYQINQKRGVI